MTDIPPEEVKAPDETPAEEEKPIDLGEIPEPRGFHVDTAGDAKAAKRKAYIRARAMAAGGHGDDVVDAIRGVATIIDYHLSEIDETLVEILDGMPDPDDDDEGSANG